MVGYNSALVIFCIQLSVCLATDQSQIKECVQCYQNCQKTVDAENLQCCLQEECPFHCKDDFMSTMRNMIHQEGNNHIFEMCFKCRQQCRRGQTEDLCCVQEICPRECNDFIKSIINSRVDTLMEKLSRTACVPISIHQATSVNHCITACSHGRSTHAKDGTTYEVDSDCFKRCSDGLVVRTGVNEHERVNELFGLDENSPLPGDENPTQSPHEENIPTENHQEEGNLAEDSDGIGNIETCFSYPGMEMQRSTSATVSCHKKVRKHTVHVYVNGQYIEVDVEQIVLVCMISE